MNIVKEYKRWLNVEQAAEYVGLGQSTLNKMRVYGDGPKFAKLGKSVRYAIDELDRWMESRLIQSTSEK